MVTLHFQMALNHPPLPSFNPDLAKVFMASAEGKPTKVKLWNNIKYRVCKMTFIYGAQSAPANIRIGTSNEPSALHICFNYLRGFPPIKTMRMMFRFAWVEFIEFVSNYHEMLRFHCPSSFSPSISMSPKDHVLVDDERGRITCQFGMCNRRWLLIPKKNSSLMP